MFRVGKMFSYRAEDHDFSSAGRAPTWTPFLVRASCKTKKKLLYRDSDGFTQFSKFRFDFHLVLIRIYSGAKIVHKSSRTIKYLKILPKTDWEEKVENLGQEGFKIFE